MRLVAMGLLGAVLGCSWASMAAAQSSVSIFEEYGKLIRSREAVVTLGNDLFGEQLNLYTGSLEFIQTDISLPGNNAPTVSVGRSFTPNQDVRPGGHFGDWQLEIPRLHGVFVGAWTVPVDAGRPASDAFLRCTKFGAPPAATGQSGGGTFDALEFWQGNFFYLPGSGDQEILRKSYAPVPTDGHQYGLVTKAGTAIRCLSQLTANSMASGEGFEAVTPDGLRYRFDHLVRRFTPALTKSSPAPAIARVPMGYQLSRQEVWILPTSVTDRFGNTVSYQWNSTDAWRLDSISSTDGRSLSFSYLEGTHQIASVSDGTRTWQYQYVTLNGTSTLASVIQPDGRRWEFQLSQIQLMTPYLEEGGCGSAGVANFGPRTGSMTHPSGATGSFTVAPVEFGRSWVPLDCRDMAGGGSPGSGYSRFPAEYIAPALTEKKLKGPGLPANGLAWTYAYGPGNNCYQPGGAWPAFGGPCVTSSPTSRTVTVTDPSGVSTRHTFGNRFEVTEGQLLRTEIGWNGSTAASTTDYTYAAPNAGPYPDPIGMSAQKRGDGYLATRHTPMRSQVIRQQGTTFTYTVNGYDQYARPLNVTKSSAPTP